jgi:DNA-binding winged helix-turn-helix (wHTH) protein
MRSLRPFGSDVRVSFGDCVLDSDTREISRGGEAVHLEPKAFALLELLIAARPKAISKSKLHEALWPNTYVSERSLARLAADLRAAIGDSAEKPRFIRTVHRFGYAFCGEVTTALARESALHCRLVWGDREIALAEGENVLGRDPRAAVWIDLDSVSRRHARIMVKEGNATLEDLGSKNGTFLEGRKVTSPAPLSNGSQIKVGAASLAFHCFRKMGTTRTETASSAKPGKEPRR